MNASFFDGTEVVDAVRSWRSWPVTTLVGWAYLATTVGLAFWVLLASVAASWQPYLVTGGSMGPDLRAGDVVLTARPEPGELTAGAVVVFDIDARPLVHRIVAVEPDGRLVTRGDANRDVDVAPVRAEEVRGVGRLVVPLIGLPLLWVRRGEVLPLALWAVVTTASLSVAWPSTRRVRRSVP